MRDKYRRHCEAVATWLEKAGRGLDGGQLLDLLQAAIRALWDAARTSISDVTLDAVLERVVINARDHFPWLPVLPIVHNAIDTSVWRAQYGRAKPGETQKAVRFLITEFMAINANLTAEMLTPSMRRGLLKVRWKRKEQGSSKGPEKEK